MTASSLPHYPDRRKASPPSPERNLSDLIASRRVHGFFIRLVFLVGIWGGLFAFRSIILSQEPEPPPDEIVGTWKATDGSGYILTFTESGRFDIILGEKDSLTGKYERQQDGTISTKRTVRGQSHGEPTDFSYDVPYATFKVVIEGDELTILDHTCGKRSIAIVQWQGESLQFKRMH